MKMLSTLPKMEEGFLSDGIGICDPTGFGTFGRCARNDGAGVISLTSAQSIQSSNN